MAKKIAVSAALFLFLFPSITFAHGGFQKQAGSVIVSIIQNPISPFVGEKVTFSFSLIDTAVPIKQSLDEQNLANWPVKLTLIKSFVGDQSRDRVILQKNLTTDVNGDFSFEYSFPEEAYYDIEFSLKDAKGQTQETGFIIQPRMPKTVEKGSNLLTGLIGFTLGIVAGIFVVKFSKFHGENK